MSDRSKHSKQPPAAKPKAAILPEAKNTRRALLVLGMHRSGTSALTRVLSLLGARLPKHVMGAGEGNEAGHWEPEKIVALHDKFLTEAGSRWDDWRPLDISAGSVFQRPETIAEIKAQIVEDYEHAPLILLKDPRISRFVPVYRSVFSQMDVTPLAVIMVRNPLAVVRSLMARKAVPINSARYASLMWLRHMLDAERETRDMPRAVVAYESLLQDWRQTLTSVDQALNLHLPLRDNDIADQIQSFLSDDHAHQDASEQSLERNAAILPLAKRAYAALLVLEKNPQDAEAKRELDEIAETLDSASVSIGAAIHDEFQLRQNHLEAVLHNAQHESHGHYVAGLGLRKEVETLHNAVWQKTTELGQLTAQAATLATTHAEAEGRVVDYANKLLDAREKSVQLLEASAQKTVDIENLRVTVVTLEGQQRDLMAMVAELTTDLSIARQAIVAAEAEIAARDAALKAAGEDINGLRTSSNGHRVHVDQLAALKVQQEELVNGLKQQAEADAATIAQLQGEIAGLKLGLEARNNDLANVQRELESQREFSNAFNARSAELEAATKKLDEQQATAERAEAELRNKIASSAEELRKTQRSLAEEREASRQAVADSEQRLAEQNELRKQIARSAEELLNTQRGLSEEREAFRQAVSDMHQQFAQQTAELAASRQALADQREAATQTEHELRNIVANSNHIIVHQQAAAATTNTDLMFARVTAYNAENAIRELEAKAAAQRNEAQGNAARAAELDAMIQALQSSASWKLTGPVRAISTGLPAISRSAKRAVRIGGYLLKGELPGKIAEWRQYRRSLRGGPEGVSGEAPTLLAQPALAAPEPLVSIVILNFNKPDLTRFAVQQILEHTRDIPVETIVVDNGSLYENYEKLAHGFPPEAKLIRLHVNRYFGEGNNIGAELGRGRYVIFLNNDAFVTANWLKPMLDVFATYPNVGGVGPKFIYPDGRLQEVGGTVAADGSVKQIGKGSLPDPSVLTEVRETEYSSAACFMMERRRFFEIGGFDLMYEPAYYEDVDLCLKLRASGQKLYVTPFSTVIHAENATSSDASTKAMQLNTIVEHNRKKFVARWAKWITDPSEPIRKSMARQIDVAPSPYRTRVAIYTPYNFVPGGGERYLLHTAQVLSECSDVTLVTEHPYSAIRIREMLRDFAIPSFPFNMAVRSEITQPFDLAVMMSNEALPPFAHIGKRNLYVCQFPFPISEHTAADRRPNLAGIDAIVVYSGFVKECLTENINRLGLQPPPIEIICPAVEGTSIPGKMLPEDGPIRIISIGRFFAGGHNKRQDALIDAAIELTRRGLPIELNLVGSVHPEPEHRQRFRELMAAAEGYPIHFHPDASPETVDALLAASHIYCHAAGLGVDTDSEPHRCEHFGISVVEGMRAASVPFVVGNGGPASIVENGVTGYHYRSVSDLADQIATLIKDPHRFAEVSAAAHRAALAFDTLSFANRWTGLAAAAVQRGIA